MTLSTLQEQVYKETELGLLPQEWEIVDLGAVTKKRSELINPSGCLLKYVGLEHIDSGAERLSRHGLSSEVRSAKSRFYKGDVLYGKLRTYLDKCVIAEIEGICSTDIIVIEPEKINGLFLAYSLHTRGFLQYSISSMTGVNHPRTSWDSLRKYVFPVPPLLEQKNIAFVLSKIQAARKKSENVIGSLKELKKSLMKHLFTYGAVSLEDAANVKLKETEIGMMPEGWHLKELGHLLKQCYRYPTYYNIQYVEEGVAEIRGELLLENGKIESDRSKYRFVSKETADKYPKVRLEEGDLVLSVRGTMGKIGYVGKELEGGVITANLIRLSPKKELVISDYLKRYLLSEKFQTNLDLLSSKTTIKTIQAPTLKSIKIPLASFQEQEKIVAILSAIDGKIGAEVDNKKALDELFKSMLYHLMTAKIRVNNLEA